MAGVVAKVVWDLLRDLSVLDECPHHPEHARLNVKISLLKNDHPFLLGQPEPRTEMPHKMITVVELYQELAARDQALPDLLEN